MAVAEQGEKSCSFDFLSPSVKKLYKSATSLDNNFLEFDEIQNYVAFNNYTFIDKKLESILEQFLMDIVSDKNSLVLSIDKLRLKDVDFYDRVLKHLCPFFYMCHLAITSASTNSTGENLANSQNVESHDLFSDGLFSWVSETKGIKGGYYGQGFGLGGGGFKFQGFHILFLWVHTF